MYIVSLIRLGKSARRKRRWEVKSKDRHSRKPEEIIQIDIRKSKAYIGIHVARPRLVQTTRLRETWGDAALSSVVHVTAVGLAGPRSGRVAREGIVSLAPRRRRSCRPHRQ